MKKTHRNLTTGLPAILLLASLALFGNAIAQPDSLWARAYGDNQVDICTDAILTTRNEHILVGAKRTRDPNDILVVKSDERGDTIWTRLFSFNQIHVYQVPGGVTELISGNYLLAGFVGDIDNEAYYGFAYCLSPEGDSLWWLGIDHGSIEEFFDCVATRDGGAVLAGHSYALNPNGAWLAKVTGDGEVEWEMSYGDPEAPGFEEIWSVVQTEDGGYAIAGNTTSYAGARQDFFLLKTDSLGNEEWRNHYGSEANETSYGMTETPDRGFLLVGYSTLLDNGDFYYVRVDSEGEMMWERLLEANYGNYCWSAEVVENGFILAGEGETIQRNRGGEEFYIVRTDTEGEPIWTTFYGARFSAEECRSVMVHSDGSYSFAGNTDRLGEGQDFWLVRTGVDPANSVVTLLDPAFPSQFVVEAPYPNPFNSSVRLSYSLPNPSQTSIRIYNQLGHQVAELYNGRLEAGQHTLNWNGYGQQSGAYFIKVDASAKTMTQKVMLVK